ncbi:MAG: DUF1566 domain-containing protein [Prevotella sp.]|nr:hypothetical protein [Prevotella sp.]MCH3994880.1 DUF1566 domain-containing protein [Prevotella sp.]
MDGIYLILKNGKKIRFTGRNSEQERKNCRYVGLKLGSKAICIALHDASADYVPLTSKMDHTDYDGYKDNYLDATADWNGKENTKHLEQIGLNPEINLEDGEYIPSAAELKFIQLFRKGIDEAIKFVGGKPFWDGWYWTSTECSSSYAWGLSLLVGNLGWGTKAGYSGLVRAVSAF